VPVNLRRYADQGRAFVNVPINIPKLGMTMMEATISEWLVGDQEQVEPGQVILVIESDKVESEIEAQVAGTLHITGATGETYLVGHQIGWIAPAE
jgi:pyruvate dehydrogenase E2 component (dihydrolipoamide acetyltransferase)